MEKYAYIFWKIVRDEFRKITESKVTIILYSIVPLLIFFSFSLVYKNEIVTEIPIAIYDEDKSDLTRSIEKMIESAPSMRIAYYANSMEEVKDLFKRNKIHSAFYFPNDFSSKIKSGKQSKAVMFINSSNLIISNSLLNDGTKILKTVNAGILMKKLQSVGLTEKQSMNILNPIRVESNILYNKNYSYITYLIPGLTTFTLMMIIIMGAIPIINENIEDEDFKQTYKLTGFKITPILIGKALPHLTFHLSNMFILIGIIFPLFHVYSQANIFVVIGFLFLFELVSFSFGMMLSSLVPQRVFATEVALFILTPAFIYSGLTFPLWAMPKIHQLIAHLIPYTYFLSGFVKIFIMDAEFVYFKNDTLILLLFLTISLLITIISFKIRLRKIKKELYEMV